MHYTSARVRSILNVGITLLLGCLEGTININHRFDKLLLIVGGRVAFHGSIP